MIDDATNPNGYIVSGIRAYPSAAIAAILRDNFHDSPLCGALEAKAELFHRLAQEAVPDPAGIPAPAAGSRAAPGEPHHHPHAAAPLHAAAAPPPLVKWSRSLILRMLDLLDLRALEYHLVDAEILPEATDDDGDGDGDDGDDGDDGAVYEDDDDEGPPMGLLSDEDWNNLLGLEVCTEEQRLTFKAAVYLLKGELRSVSTVLFDQNSVQWNDAVRSHSTSTSSATGVPAVAGGAPLA